jgi:MFS family permease
VKTAVWLYLFLFVAFFDLHAQYPMLTPFAVSLGAAPSFIGLMMGMYSLTHLPGNVLAGYGVDRLGSRLFIAGSLVAVGALLVIQARVTDPWQLLAVRSVCGFAIAFLSPACLSLLGKLARDRIMQGKLMAVNGLVHTVASVVSPAAGAWLAAQLGFAKTFAALGWVLIATGVMSLWLVADAPSRLSPGIPAPGPAEELPAANASAGRFPWSVLLLPLSLACAQGILAFELPFKAGGGVHDVMHTGWLFTLVSLGALTTLSLFTLQRLPTYMRTVAGAGAMALCFWLLASRSLGGALPVLLFLLGMAKGVTLPAMNTFLMQLSESSRYGRTFSALSIAMSIGAFLGPLAAGLVRDRISPYFLGFLVIMLALLALTPRPSLAVDRNSRPSTPPSGA